MIEVINKIKAEYEKLNDECQTLPCECWAGEQAEVLIKTSLTLVDGMIKVLEKPRDWDFPNTVDLFEINSEIQQLTDFKAWLEERE